MVLAGIVFLIFDIGLVLTVLGIVYQISMLWIIGLVLMATMWVASMAVAVSESGCADMALFVLLFLPIIAVATPIMFACNRICEFAKKYYKKVAPSTG